MCNFSLIQEEIEWLKSPAGRVASIQKHRMLESLLSGWPRRGYSVLEMGCSSGNLLELLWEAGLDPTAICDSPGLLDNIRKHLGSKVDLHFGKLENLPFDNDEFDYVTLLSAMNFAKDPEIILSEAFRVASCGILIVFTNSWSCLALQKTFGRGPSYLGNLEYFSLPRILSIIRKLADKSTFTFRSTLLGPVATWKEKGFFNFFNRIVSPLPFGACAGIRIDLSPQPAGMLMPLSVDYMPVDPV